MAATNNHSNRANSRVNNINTDSDQSSLDLSLCLRRGSSDSRDSFYMDFDRGIDSDIDDVVADDQLREIGGDERQSYVGTDDDYDEDDDGKTRRERKHRVKRHRTRLHPTWKGLCSSRHNNGHPSTVDEDSALPPSPVCTTRILASPEQASIMSSSQGTTSGRLPNDRFQSQTTSSVNAPLVAESRSKNYEAVRTSRKRARYYRRNFDEQISNLETKTNSESVCSVLSSMYAKLLMVMGIGFPLSEVVSPTIPHSFFVGFYLYLYSASILFLIYGYSFLLPKKEKTSVRLIVLRKLCLLNAFKSNVDQSPAVDPLTVTSRAEERSKRHIRNNRESGCGSFYLRLGAMAFGIGSMIYSGLEFGQYFELDRHSYCYSVLTVITPCTQIAFIFIQLYFIFKNSKMRIYKYRNVARFGLMHMVATNLCVWFYVLVQESKHEIFKLKEVSLNNDIVHLSNNSTNVHIHHASPPQTNCARNWVMGQLVQDVSPFLFPCTIQYSLICAAVLYVMWKNMNHSSGSQTESSVLTTLPTSRHSQQHNVDCTHANKGLFAGIIFFVLAIISLIVFFVFIRRVELRELAIMEAHIYELALYCVNTVAAIIALVQIRELRYSVNHRRVELENILLIVAQTGVYIFVVFCVIGGQFTASRNSSVLNLLTAVTNLLQATVQTIFLLDASGRYAATPDQVRRKPGREMITFLLVCNFAMWVIGTLETKRSYSNPVQLNFYGFWAWTIIAHVSTPLAIFFRFHSTTCLCEIWCKLYKLRVEQV